MTLLCYHFEGAYAPKYFSVLSGIFICEKVSSAQVIIVVIVSTLSAGMFFFFVLLLMTRWAQDQKVEGSSLTNLPVSLLRCRT